MKRTTFRFILPLWLALLLAACGAPGTFNQYRTVPAKGWNKDSLLVFDVPITDTVQQHNLYLGVRNDINYRYSNLWLFIEIIPPDNSAQTDTFEITLADPAGKWLGKGYGGIKTCETIYTRNVRFPLSGTYRVIIRHGMRDKLLSGITDIGIRVEEQ